MPELVTRLILPALAAALFDWIVVGKLAALAPSSSYHYKPTVWRYLALLVVAVWLGYAGEAYKPWFASMWAGLLALLSYAAFAMFDVLHQRKRTSDKPPDERYDF